VLIAVLIGTDVDAGVQETKKIARRVNNERFFMLSKELPNALVEWLGGGTRSLFGIRTTFGMLIVQINRQNPAKSTSNQRLGQFWD
jgi:hypothetical protein